MKAKSLFFLLFLLFAVPGYADTAGDEDIHTAIISEMNETMNDYFFYQRSTISLYRNYQNDFQTPEILLNGGSEYMHDFVINGLSFKDPLTGTLTATFSPKLFATKEIYDSHIPGRYGNVTSGLFLFKTPDVSKDYSGHIESLSDNFIGNKFDQNYYRAVVSGSMFNSQKIGFWAAVERRWLGDRSPSSLTDDVLLDGSDMLPNNLQSGWNYHGKIQFEISEQTKLVSTVDGANDEWQDYRHHFNNIFYPTQIEHTPRYKDKTIGINNTIHHKFSENTKVDFSFGYFKSEYLHGDGVIFDNLFAYKRTNPNPYYDDYSLFREGMTFADGFYESYYENYLHKISSYNQYQGRLIKKYHQNSELEIGYIHKKYTLRYYNNTLPTNSSNLYGPGEYSSVYLNRYGFSEDGKESDSEDWQNSTKHPTELSFYLNNRISLDKVNFELALRSDRYKLNTKQVINPFNPFDPFSLNPGDNSLDEVDMVNTTSNEKLSYRIALEYFPISKISFAVNWQDNYQIAPYGYQYLGWDYFEARTSAGFFTPFSAPLMDLMRSKMLGLKLTAQLSHSLKLTILKKYLKYKNDISYIDVSPAIPFVYSRVLNGNELVYRPFTVSLSYEEKKLKAFTMVTYGDVDGFEHIWGNYNILWKNSTAVPGTEYPCSYSKEFIFSAGISYCSPLKILITALGKYESGYHYTPMLVFDAVTSRSVDRNAKGWINSAESEDVKVIDLKLEREFQYKSMTITPFILVKNLLDDEIITGVYEGSGSPTSTGFLETAAGQQMISTFGADYEDRYRFLQQDPRNFYPPRQIFIGLKASF